VSVILCTENILQCTVDLWSSTVVLVAGHQEANRARNRGRSGGDLLPAFKRADTFGSMDSQAAEGILALEGDTARSCLCYVIASPRMR
jgi:hypothetical protein